MADDKMKISPDVCSYVDEEGNQIQLEVSLPGVKKEDINLKLTDDSFNLSAPRDDFDYVAASTFCCPVNASGATANYENGLLKISVPFKDPMANAIQVSVS